MLYRILNLFFKAPKALSNYITIVHALMPCRCVFFSKTKKENHYAFPSIERLLDAGARGHIHRQWRDRTACWRCWAHPSPGTGTTDPSPIQNQPQFSIFERRSERDPEQPQSHRPRRRSPSISSPLPLGKALSFARSTLGSLSRFHVLICAVSARI